MGSCYGKKPELGKKRKSMADQVALCMEMGVGFVEIGDIALFLERKS